MKRHIKTSDQGERRRGADVGLGLGEERQIGTAEAEAAVATDTKSGHDEEQDIWHVIELR